MSPTTLLGPTDHCSACSQGGTGGVPRVVGRRVHGPWCTVSDIPVIIVPAPGPGLLTSEIWDMDIWTSEIWDMDIWTSEI